MAEKKPKTLVDLSPEDALAALGMKILNTVPDIPRYSTGSLLLDDFLGGGLPIGNIVEFWGDPGNGKTTTMLLAARTVLSQIPEGKRVFWLNTERALDPRWMRRLGIPLDNRGTLHCPLDIVQGGENPNLETFTEAMKALIRSGKYAYGFVDSIAKFIPHVVKEIQLSDLKGPQMGVAARMTGLAISQIQPLALEYECGLAFSNQVRTVNTSGYGNPKGTPGGYALQHSYAARIQVMSAQNETFTKEGEWVTKDLRYKHTSIAVGDPVENELLVKVIQDVEGNVGWDVYGELFDAGKARGWFLNAPDKVYTGAGNCFLECPSDIAGDLPYENGMVKLGVGAENIKRVIRENGSLAQFLMEKAYA